MREFVERRLSFCACLLPAAHRRTCPGLVAVVSARMGAPPAERLVSPTAPFWSHKPWWCQPWSIVGTGLAVSAASWVLLQRWWITAPVVAAVLVWWWLFLVLVPAASAVEEGQLRAAGDGAEPCADDSSGLDL